MKTKQVLLASALCFAPFAAHAADMPAKAPIYKAPVAPPFSWTGFYVGASAGFISQRTDVDAFFSAPTVVGTRDITGAGFIGGGNIGYNWQVDPHWVIGLEADISGASLDNDSDSLFGVSFSSRLDALGTVRARFGYAFDRALLYATGGWAYGHVRNEVSGLFGFGGSTDHWESGWTAGGGLEYAFLPNWTVRGEALYVDLGSHDVDFQFLGLGCRFGFKNRYTIGRLGVNYKF